MALAMRMMPVTTHAALLQALRLGAGYGLDLIRRIDRLSQGRIRLSEARVYSALKDLSRRRLVTTSCVTPGGRRGARARTYYDLTLRGVEISTLQYAALSALVAPLPHETPSHRGSRLMARRLGRAEAVSELAEDLRAGMLARD
jgi:DNA-binding PadR family transcriptional regulator